MPCLPSVDFRQLMDLDVRYGGYFLFADRLVPGSFLTRTSDPRFGEGWLFLFSPSRVLTAWSIGEVREVLREAEAFQGFACGFVSYEASPAFDPAFVVQTGGRYPLAQFGLYSSGAEFFKEIVPSLPLPEPHPNPPQGEGTQLSASFSCAFKEIKERLFEGETYQVNYSFRLSLEIGGPAASFVRLAAEDPPPYATYFETSDVAIASLSPELFFLREGSNLTCEPMKGTAEASEVGAAERLRTSPKERAENLMVVDMIRNDLGRIARVGSVKVPKLFEVHRYPTVYQMTSTVAAETVVSTDRVFEALFPCASIVGAPKVATMKIISELEESPRGIYTGALGFMTPGMSRFSVAIRTLTQASGGVAEYGVGSGIVWDSEESAEWEECRMKARALDAESEPWALLETMRWTPEEGVFLLDRHLDRLERAARSFEILVDRRALYARLRSLSYDGGRRLRLLLQLDGSVEIQDRPLLPIPSSIRVALAMTPVRSGDPFLQIKNNRRAFYRRHIEANGAEDVLLWNERGEATETCNGNLVVELDGRLVTPPVSCGLLNGVYRQLMIDEGRVEERVVTLEELSGRKMYRLNSVSEMVEIHLDRSRDL